MDDFTPSIPGYEILGELGRRGIGIVYKAKDLRIYRLVAVKLILSGRGADFVELDHAASGSEFRRCSEQAHRRRALRSLATGGYGGSPSLGSVSGSGIVLSCWLGWTVRGARCHACGTEVFAPRLSAGDDRPRPRGAAS
jgi:hypothetical protein